MERILEFFGFDNAEDELRQATLDEYGEEQSEWRMKDARPISGSGSRNVYVSPLMGTMTTPFARTQEDGDLARKWYLQDQYDT